MKAAYIQPFVTAAVNVLRSELGTEVKRGQLALETTYYSMNDIVVLIGITGEIEGTVVYATDEDVAKKMVERMTGEMPVMLDEVCESAFAELGNIISGNAMAIFEQQGINCNISPPSIIVGRGAILSSVDIQRMIIPLLIDFGEIQISVALREAVPGLVES